MKLNEEMAKFEGEYLNAVKNILEARGELPFSVFKLAVEEAMEIMEQEEEVTK